jgi:hypothetical protein
MIKTKIYLCTKRTLYIKPEEPRCSGGPGGNRNPMENGISEALLPSNSVSICRVMCARSSLARHDDKWKQKKPYWQ